MNPMYDFTDKEIGLLDMAVGAVMATTEMAIEQGATPPDGLVETLQTTYNKLQSVIELRCKEFNEFQEIAQHSLNDVIQASDLIIKNPDSPLNEYN